jgi:ESS family glutamate:Na+ symporter
MKKRGKIKISKRSEEVLNPDDIQNKGEIPMQESVDKITIQVCFVAVAYFVAYLMMYGLGELLPGMKSTIYGFNFLLGVISATLIKITLNFFKNKKIIKKQYTNNFLMTRVSNFFFDIMVVAGIAAINLGALQNYWGVIIIIGVVGLLITYFYNRIVAKTLFKEYQEEQFLAMYGMLTGTASTGVILLREIDEDFKTPAQDNLIYQTFPAIVFGFPIMLLATFAPKEPYWTLAIFIAFFFVMNIILFRRKIFRFKKKNKKGESSPKDE